MTPIEQGLAQVGANEARGSCHDCSRHRFRSRLRAELAIATGRLRSALKEPTHDREQDDLEIERDRPVLDVVQVVLEPFLERRVARASR